MTPVNATKADIAPDPEREAAASLAVREGIVELQGSFPLYHGGSIEAVRLAWRLAGPADAPVVAALGGISASRTVFAVRGAQPPGWWNGMVGPGCPVDADRFAILGFDFLGGSGGTTGPAVGASFPSVSSYDQAELLHRLLGALGINRLRAIVGASYGGMVALAFAELFPAEVERIVAISAADRTHPMATAWRSVQRAVVRYAAARGEGSEGLKLARALAMATYRSPTEFAERFGGEPERCSSGFSFPVEGYLFARGDAYAQRYVPEAFVCLSESIDLHRVRGERITVPTTLVGVLEDQLVPISDIRDLAARLGAPCELVEISSLYGHDAFLKEAAALRPVFARALESAAPGA